jgi:phosphoribosylformimino-5-aminoimidazole carboxamide ribotide isomerase
LKTVPVIDLSQGTVVHAIAGERAKYRPVKSKLTDRCDPFGIARFFHDLYGFNLAYVADLDAIAGKSVDVDSVQQIAAAGLDCWLDAGVGSVRRAEQLKRIADRISQLSAVVLGLESLTDPVCLQRCLETLGPERTIFSMDLRNGTPITPSPTWQRYSPLEICEQVIREGIRRIIVLDLARVGTGGGLATVDLCQALLSAHPGLEVTTGGGIRGPEDLEPLRAAGCSAVLIASALHDGRFRHLENEV